MNGSRGMPTQKFIDSCIESVDFLGYGAIDVHNRLFQLFNFAMSTAHSAEYCKAILFSVIYLKNHFVYTFVSEGL